MKDQRSSRTAEYMAFFRLLESIEPAERRLFTDPYALPLLAGPLKTVARIARFPLAGSVVRAILELGWPYTRSSGVIRTRAIDDLVSDAIRSGAGQLVLLGAGFDSRAYRLPEATRITSFEVDHPATQRTKRERLGALTGQLNANVQFVPVDFEKDDLESKLIQAGFDRAIPTVVLWEGVISYLTRSAVEGTFALLGRLLAPTSHLIFTYVHQAALDGSRVFRGARRWKSWVRFSGEPFVFGFDPDALPATLRSFGFILRSDESTEQTGQRYCAPLGRKEPGSELYRVASAVRAKG